MPRGNGEVKRARVKRSIEVFLPVKALSTNKLYSGRKVRSWHYKRFRKQVFKILDTYDKENLRLSGNLKLKLEVGFSSPLSDLSNAIKSVEDVIAEWIGFNDKQIVSIEMEKYLVNKGSEYMRVQLSKTNKNIDKRNKYAKEV